jgi:hypothetical protein
MWGDGKFSKVAVMLELLNQRAPLFQVDLARIYARAGLCAAKMLS